MQLDPVTGWFSGVSHCPSPNCNARPSGCAIDLLVIHNISLPPGQFGTGKVQQFFQNRLDPDEHPYFQGIAAMTVAAHLFVERDGAVTQFVSLLDRAWHAGVSAFEGRQGCNDFSIGIELEGTDTLPYTEAQYLALQALTKQIQTQWPAIDAQHICGHSDIAPQRKTDPGPAFDWPRYRAALTESEVQP